MPYKCTPLHYRAAPDWHYDAARLPQAGRHNAHWRCTCRSGAALCNCAGEASGAASVAASSAEAHLHTRCTFQGAPEHWPAFNPAQGELFPNKSLTIGMCLLLRKACPSEAQTTRTCGSGMARACRCTKRGIRTGHCTTHSKKEKHLRSKSTRGRRKRAAAIWRRRFHQRPLSFECSRRAGGRPSTTHEPVRIYATPHRNGHNSCRTAAGRT